MLILMWLVDVVQSFMIIAEKYRNNSVTKRRIDWSLKIRCGMLPSNIACTPKITSGPSFFLRR